MPKQLFLESRVIKFLAKTDPDLSERVQKHIFALEQNPLPANSCKMVSRSFVDEDVVYPAYRLRIGKVRVIYYFTPTHINVMDAEMRGKIYRKK